MANKIVGNPTVTPMAVPDWNQTDSSKADYIKNKPNLSKVATSGSYNDLIDKPDSPGGGGSTTNSINYDDIDTTFDCGMYLVDGRERPSNDGKKEILVVSSSESGVGQFYFYDDGRISYRQYQSQWSDWSDFDITSYKIETEYYGVSRDDSALLTLAAIKQLIGYEVPIVFCSSNPINMDLTQTRDATAYFYVSANSPKDSVFLFQQWTEEWYEEEQDKLNTYTQTIIDSSGVRVREKVVSTWGIIPTIDKWEWKPLNDYTPTIDMMRQAIADLVDSAPDTLDTLKEISEALNNDPNFANTILTELGKKANKSDLPEVAISGKYADLLGQPFTVLEYYPRQAEIDEMLYGTYVHTAYADFDASLVVVAGCVSDIVHETPNGDLAKVWTYRQTIIDRNRVKVREKAICDNYDDWNYDWREVPLNDNIATKEYVNTAIGDIETSLENIITKYGLGGDKA